MLTALNNRPAARRSDSRTGPSTVTDRLHRGETFEPCPRIQDPAQAAEDPAFRRFGVGSRSTGAIAIEWSAMEKTRIRVPRGTSLDPEKTLVVGGGNFVSVVQDGCPGQGERQ